MLGLNTRENDNFLAFSEIIKNIMNISQKNHYTLPKSQHKYFIYKSFCQLTRVKSFFSCCCLRK